MNTTRLFDAMTEKGITQRGLADMIGVTQPSVSYIVTGRVEPSLKLLKKISEALKVPADELL